MAVSSLFIGGQLCTVIKSDELRAVRQLRENELVCPNGHSPLPMDIAISQGGRHITGCNTGSWLWHSSVVLERTLLKLRCWRGCRVLELGSGTGWLALRLASLGAKVTATDVPGALALLNTNIMNNQLLLAKRIESKRQQNRRGRDGTVAIHQEEEGEEREEEEREKEEQCGAVTDNDDCPEEVHSLEVHAVAKIWGEEVEEVEVKEQDGDNHKQAADGAKTRPTLCHSSSLGYAWDILIGSDLLYLQETHAALLFELVQHCSIIALKKKRTDSCSLPRALFVVEPAAQVVEEVQTANSHSAAPVPAAILCYEQRYPAQEQAFFAQAHALGLLCTLVAEDKIANAGALYSADCPSTERKFFVMTFSMRA